jgi:hypothetical protein
MLAALVDKYVPSYLPSTVEKFATWLRFDDMVGERVVLRGTG